MSFTCKECSKSFLEETLLQKHVFEVHDRRMPYQCEECSMSFPKPHLLIIHQRIHSEDKPYKCELCQASFDRMLGLRTHSRIHNVRIKKPNRCFKSSGLIIPSENIQKDVCNRNVEKNFKCKICSAVFTTEGYLKRHLNFHAGDNKQLFEIQNGTQPKQCSDNSKSGITSEDNKKHINPYKGERYICKICSASFTSGGMHQSHVKLHQGEKYTCVFCSASFRSKSCLKGHVQLKRCQQYKCSWCSTVFSNHGLLESHLLTHDSKPYKCQSCKSSFRTKADLKSHQEIHLRKRPYKCDVCSASFLKAVYLIRHQREHNEDRPHKCHICSATFKKPEHLNLHLRRYHGRVSSTTSNIEAENLMKYINSLRQSVSKSYKCEKCSASFSTAETLTKHCKTHSNERSQESQKATENIQSYNFPLSVEKPYQCDVCFASFAQADWLKIHSSIHIQ